jgi:hypothetical protein
MSDGKKIIRCLSNRTNDTIWIKLIDIFRSNRNENSILILGLSLFALRFLMVRLKINFNLFGEFRQNYSIFWEFSSRQF